MFVFENHASFSGPKGECVIQELFVTSFLISCSVCGLVVYLLCRLMEASLKF